MYLESQANEAQHGKRRPHTGIIDVTSLPHSRIHKLVIHCKYEKKKKNEVSRKPKQSGPDGKK
jgi:hypothetical protein